MRVIVKIRAILTRALVLLAFLSASELSAQEQVGEVFPYSFTTAVPTSLISKLSEGVLLDVYWTGTTAEFPGQTVTRLVAEKVHLVSAFDIRSSQSDHPNLMQAEITVEMNTETIRTQRSLAVGGRFTITASQ